MHYHLLPKSSTNDRPVSQYNVKLLVRKYCYINYLKLGPP